MANTKARLIRHARMLGIARAHCDVPDTDEGARLALSTFHEAERTADKLLPARARNAQGYADAGLSHGIDPNDPIWDEWNDVLDAYFDAWHHAERAQ